MWPVSGMGYLETKVPSSSPALALLIIRDMAKQACPGMCVHML